MEKEIWKSVAGYELGYEVSNLGNVRSLPRQYRHAIHINHKITRKGRMLKQRIGRGYLTVKLHKKNIPQTITTHRLVANAFIPNPEMKPCINHKNGIKTDNRLVNLEWCTHKENSQHAHKKGLVKHRSGYDNHLSKPINQFSLSGEFIREWSGKLAAAKALNLSSGNLGLCLNGKRKQVGGFLWKRKHEDQTDNIFFI